MKKTKDEVGKSFQTLGIFPRAVVKGTVEPLDQELGLRSSSGWMVEGPAGEDTGGFGGEGGGMEGVEVGGFGRVGLGSWKNGFRSETWNTGWMARRGGRSRR